MRTNLPNEIPDVITRPALAASVPDLMEFVSQQAWEYGFHDEQIKGLAAAVEEALHNILVHACHGREGEIRVSCSIHMSGALQIIITDTGIPFNMLLASAFPEADDVTESGEIPSTRVMKKAVKNIEYKRDKSENTLIFMVPKE